MYSIHSYGEMIADPVRTDAYAQALRQCITPDSVVLEIGTGTGLFAILACRYGARRVFAVETNDAIDVARTIAAANQCAGAIEFIQGTSTDIDLHERADVIVSDLRGVLPLFNGHIHTIADARRRLLAPGGVLIPRSDTMWLACVEAADLHRSVATPWLDNPFGVNMRAAADLVANQWCRAVVTLEQLMTPPTCLATLDYTGNVEPDLNARVTITAARAGVAHGLCLWFDAVLAEGITLSNAPGQPTLIYGNAFFPWPEPVELEAGDTLTVAVRGDLIDGEHLWSWDTCIRRHRNPDQAAFHFRQSQFFATPLSPGKLRRQAADHVPALSEDGTVDCLILEMMREGASLGDIAHRLVALYPARFARWQDALSRAAKLSMTYGS